MKLVVDKDYRDQEVLDASDVEAALTSIEAFTTGQKFDADNIQLSGVRANNFSGDFGNGSTVTASVPASVTLGSIGDDQLVEGAISNSNVADGIITNEKMFDFKKRTRAFSLDITALSTSYQDICSFNVTNARPFILFLMGAENASTGKVSVDRSSSSRNSTELILDIGLKRGETEVSYGRLAASHARSNSASTQSATALDVVPQVICLYDTPNFTTEYELSNISNEGSDYYYAAQVSEPVTYKIVAKYSGDTTSAGFTSCKAVLLEL